MAYDFPLLMSAPMVLACLRGARGETGGKTQHRVLPTPDGLTPKQWDLVERRFLAGEPVQLWVRETACVHGGEVFYRANPAGTVVGLGGFAKWTPSIQMPRWASRLTLLDVTIRRERLGDISEADARAEGVYRHPKQPALWAWQIAGAVNPPAKTSVTTEPAGWVRAVHAYANLWGALHGPGSWERDADKEVMVIGFRPVARNIDAVEG